MWSFYIWKDTPTFCENVWNKQRQQRTSKFLTSEIQTGSKNPPKPEFEHHQIESIQRRALKIICGQNYTTYNEICSNLKLSS